MRNRATIGIEIASGEVRGACVHLAGATAQLTGAVSVPLPPGGRDADGLLDVEQVGDAVHRVCAQLDPKASALVVGLTDCSLVARVMEIPPVPDSEVRPVLRGEMDHYRILPAGQSAFDFYRLPDATDRETDGEEADAVRVLLIGAEERLVATYRAVADAAHANLTAVEPGSVAVLRALYPMVREEPAVACVVVSATATDVLITQHGALQFFRRIDTGLQELYNRTAVTETAEPSVQIRGGLLISNEAEPAPAGSGQGQADPYNRQAISLLMTEVQRSIDYFVREYRPAEGKITLKFAIGRSDTDELFALIRKHLRSKAELASPLDYLQVSPEASEMVQGTDGRRYTAAIGLALRGAEGDYAGAPALDLGVGDRVIVDRRMAPKLMLVSAAVTAFIMLGTVVAALLVSNRIGAAERTRTQVQHELDALTLEHAQRVAALERQKKLALAIYAADKPIREGVEFVSASMTSRACLTAISIDGKGTIGLSGEALSPHAVADIMDTINLSPALEPVRLDNIARLDVTGSVPTVSFQMRTGFTVPPTPAPATPAGPATGPAGGATTPAAAGSQGGH